jgi:hypothetical protein
VSVVSQTLYSSQVKIFAVMDHVAIALDLEKLPVRHVILSPEISMQEIIDAAKNLVLHAMAKHLLIV